MTAKNNMQIFCKASSHSLWNITQRDWLGDEVWKINIRKREQERETSALELVHVILGGRKWEQNGAAEDAWLGSIV